ncbi:MAG: tyrosine--tRNA ligase [Alphaproteobacteria bacterium]|nr:tyrosine--tRNA ligase [Alphaproteobacteria bacterium]
MSNFRSEFLREAHARGFIHQITDESGLDAKLASGTPQVAYIGFDATADSLHAGSLVQIMLLRLFQRTGHRPLVLMGGGTTKIGDPSGRDETRKLLSDADIAANTRGIRAVFDKYLDFGPGKALSADNSEWLDGLKYIPLLREVGRHFSVNRMLSMDSVKLRLERDQPLSFIEFNYMVLQSFDFVELARRYGCIMQMGGSDQWGNIVMGAELGRRMGGLELFGLTTPLLTTSSGAKMGKTAAGAVWLNADRLSPYDYFQYWRNTEDADVVRFLKLFTDLPLAEIAKLEKLAGAEINEAKKVLAFEVTKLCHGESAATEAAETARRTFEQGAAAEGLPTIEVPGGELERGIAVLDLFVRANLAASKSEARRLVQGKGAKLNDAVVESDTLVVNRGHLAADGAIKLTAGKKRHALVRAV